MDINEIKAGTYLLVSKLWDEILSKPGEPFNFTRHRRGDVLDLNIEDARRLVLAGAVVEHDPANPKYAVSPDGHLTEVLPADPFETGLVLSQDHLVDLGVPVDATADEIVSALKQLVADKAAADEAAHLARSEAAPVASPAGETRPASDRIEDIVRWVGTDKARATIALEGERTTKGEGARPRLVTALEEILTAPEGGQ